MTPSKTQPFRGVSLKRELVEQIERFVEEHPQYKSKADFVHEAVRLRMEQIRATMLPRFEQINCDENGTKILDRELGEVVQVYFKPQGILCENCQTNHCTHIAFALSQPNIQTQIRKKRKEGWQLPEV